MSKDSIVGSWKLVSFNLRGDGEKWIPWGRDTRGSLKYEQDGSMSVQIDKNLSDADRSSNDILHYAGTYELRDNKIFHQVTEASDPNRIGQELVRDVEFSAGRMILTGASASGKQFQLIWEKI